MKKLILILIKAYRRYISPSYPPTCRFSPSCSEYALQAVETHGAIVGVFLALGRLLRCNPLFPGGYDPVPPTKH